MIKPVCQYRNGASSQTALMTCLINPSGKARNDSIAAIAYLSGIAMCQLTGIHSSISGTYNAKSGLVYQMFMTNRAEYKRRV